jgi:hypothetical protein
MSTHGAPMLSAELAERLRTQRARVEELRGRL